MSCAINKYTVYSRLNTSAPLNILHLSISMDTTLSGLTIVPDELHLSQLPFFSEDCVYNNLSMPQIPPSVCKACWKGPFARNLGLFCTSPRDPQWYPPWPQKTSYSTSFARLQSSADAGCVWCRFVLQRARKANREFGKRLIIKIRSTTARRWFNHSGWPGWDHSTQELKVVINGVYGLYTSYILSTDPGVSRNILVFAYQVPGY